MQTYDRLLPSEILREFTRTSQLRRLLGEPGAAASFWNNAAHQVLLDAAMRVLSFHYFALSRL